MQVASKLDCQIPEGFIGQVGIIPVRRMHVNLAFCAVVTKAQFCCLTFQSRTKLNQQIFKVGSRKLTESSPDSLIMGCWLSQLE